MSGVGRSSIGNYEIGTQAISIEKLKKIAECLKIHVDEIAPHNQCTDPSLALNKAKEAGGFDMEEQVLNEIRIRIVQFKVQKAKMRSVLSDQIASTIKGYDAYCETRYAETRAVLLDDARRRADEHQPKEEK